MLFKRSTALYTVTINLSLTINYLSCVPGAARTIGRLPGQVVTSSTNGIYIIPTHPCRRLRRLHYSIRPLPPVCYAVALCCKLLSLKRLGEYICIHKICRPMYQRDFTQFDSFAEPEISYVDMPRPFRCWTSARHYRHAAEVVLIDYHWHHPVSLTGEEIP